MKTSTPFLLTLAALAAFAGSPAEARGGRGRDDLAADPSSAVAGAELSVRLREKGRGRWEFRMQMENAPQGLSPSVLIADAGGTLVAAGSLVPDDNDVGEYKLRLRSQKGGSLPAGAASLADLGGRAYEVRESGVAIFSGTLPVVASDAKSSGGGSGGGADDPAGHDAGDDHGGTSGGHGADDPAGHDAGDDHGGSRGRGRGADDPAKRGADDAAGHVRRGRGRDDGPRHR